MKTYRIALIGFGNVGQGLAHIIAERQEVLAEKFGLKLQIVAISDLIKGSLYNPDGLDPADLLAAVEDSNNLEKVPAPQRGWDALKTITDTNADVIAEFSYTDLETGQPATRHIETALKSGKHVITTNKGPIALHYAHLAELARTNGVTIGIEGTVMSGTPAVHLGLDMLYAAGIKRIQGILNGTTNYILTRMEAGDSYEDALAKAQKLGYAEADPTGDVEGFDAAGKVVILANLLMDASLKMSSIDRQGISKLTAEDIQQARQADECWKLIGALEKDDHGRVTASVKPTRLSKTHPLASVIGAANAITFTTDLLGDVTLVGPGAGRLETGYALLVDLLAIHRKTTAVS
jgi:homoserine dehydrogenase